MIRNQAWYNANSSRPYPFDDGATLLDDAGVRPPFGLIVGLKAMIPESAGRFVYVGGMTVSPKLVTVILLASDSLDSSTNAQAVLSVSVPRTSVRYQQHALSSLYPYAAGWIVFGPSLDDSEYAGRFSLPRQSLLSPRAASWHRDLPIQNVAKLGGPGMTGLVLLEGGNDIEIVSECREIPGQPVGQYDPQYCGNEELGTNVRQVIVFRLKDTSVGQEQNVLNLYRGQCGRRPESQTCGEPQPIEAMGPVVPDCCGNITIEFRGCANISAIASEVTLNEAGDVVAEREACGFQVDCNLGLDDVCVEPDWMPDESGRLPAEADECESVSFVSESEAPEPPSVSDPPFEFDAGDASENEDPALPHEDDFEVLGDYVIRTGDFKYRADSGDALLTAASPAMRNVATYEPASLPSAFFKRVSARVELRAQGGALHNAAVISGYRETEPDSGAFSYYVAEIDLDGHYRGFPLFRLAKFTGASWVNLFSIAVSELELNHSYDIGLEIYQQPDDLEAVWLRGTLTSAEGGATNIVIGPLSVNDYGSEGGLFGVGTNRAVSRFHAFSVDNITEAP